LYARFWVRIFTLIYKGICLFSVEVYVISDTVVISDNPIKTIIFDYIQGVTQVVDVT